MASEKQIAANRLNAQRSTGPKTAAGKEASARNALKHGLSTKKYLRDDEEPAEFEAKIYKPIREDYQPRDVFEDDIVLKIAMSYWRLDRAFKAEAEHSPLANMLLGDHDDRIRNLACYEAMIRKDLRQLEQSLADHRKRLEAQEIPSGDVIGSAEVCATEASPPPDSPTIKAVSDPS